MNLWPKKELGSGITLVSGQHIPVNECGVDGKGIPYLAGPADFDETGIKAKRFTERPRVLCQKGDILITVKGSGTGTVALADNDYCIGRQLMAVRSTDWDRDFLHHILKYLARYFNGRATGLIPGIGRDDILELPVMQPEMPVQKAIAAILGTWDRAIEKLQALVMAKTKRKRGLMQQLLTGQIRVKI